LLEEPNVSAWRRLLVFALGLGIAFQAVVLCGATGWRALTRFPSAEIAKTSSDGALSALFDDAGLNEDRGRMESLTNEFTFGWLPSPTFGPEALSVASVGGPGLLAALVALLPSRRR
jgi:hypothetical protein